MPLSNSEVGRRFWKGEKSGRAQNMKIVDSDKHTLLVDFDWAVLAKRHKETGLVTRYSGWDRFSPTTKRHISISNLRDAKFTEDIKLQLSDDIQEDESAKQFGQKYSDVSIDPFTKKIKLIKRR